MYQFKPFSVAFDAPVDVMNPVYNNGKTGIGHTLDEIRTRATL